MATPDPLRFTTPPERIGAYVIHPIASMFPLMEGDAYAELKKSIETNGQQQPIIMFRSVLIDGRNRLRVLHELGKEPVFQEYTGTLSVEEYILASNLFRRHLTNDQRMMITTEAMLWKETEEARQRQKELGKQKGGGAGRQTLGAKSTQGSRAPKVSEKIAAAAKGTDHQARQAIAVLKHTPELATPVKEGRVPLRKAAKEAHRRATKPRRSTPPAAKPDAPSSGTYKNEMFWLLAVEEIALRAQVEYRKVPEECRAEFKKLLYSRLAQNLG